MNYSMRWFRPRFRLYLAGNILGQWNKFGYESYPIMVQDLSRCFCVIAPPNPDPLGFGPVSSTLSFQLTGAALWSSSRLQRQTYSLDTALKNVVTWQYLFIYSSHLGPESTVPDSGRTFLHSIYIHWPSTSQTDRSIHPIVRPHLP